MTEPKQGVKTLGVKLRDDLHSQFALVCQLEGLSLADGVIQAVEQYVSAKQAQGDFQQRAAEVLAEIEREAEQRRTAIQSLLGAPPATPAEPGTKGRTRKPDGEPSA